MALPSIPWGNIVLGVFLLYVLNSISVFYSLYYPVLCSNDSKSCFSSQFKENSFYDYYLIASLEPHKLHRQNIIFTKRHISLTEEFEEVLNVDFPKDFVKNTTIYGHLIIVSEGADPLANSKGISGHYVTPLTSFKKPDAVKINLIESTKIMDNSSVIAHVRPRLISHALDPSIKFDGQNYPSEFRRVFDKNSMTYKPVVYIDQLSLTRRYDKPLTTTPVNLTISYAPISIGKLRIWMQFEEAVQNLKDLGFGEDDVDEIKSIFTDTNMYFLTLTFFVTIFHLLFDCLAFKNDISFWKNRKNMAGLSTRVIIWRCFSQMIIFLYLCEHKTSYIVLGPAGVGMFIELWKVSKSLKCSFAGGKITFGDKTLEEKATEEIDSEAMWYLQWIMYPLIIGGAVYSLLYTSQRSWYSWVINSLVNGVYCFGFLFMTPQLFLNYRLKSIAHLPWRAFMYKAFNTFIDDVFAFIITMPTAHRLACFRDDIIFLIYLYQRWLYPVDKSRVNEFGQIFEEADASEKKDQ